MSLAGRDITVIGGGVAGLSVARAMALRGARVRVCEQAPEIGEVGAGLQISPNGLKVIDALGLGDDLRAVSVAGQAVRLRDYRGGDVLRLDLAGRESPGVFLFVHRARLVEVLERGAREAGVAIETGRQVTPPGPEGLVIGADGLHSWVRADLNGPAAPFFTGQAAWRALIHDLDSAPEVEVFMGPGRHLVTYPLGQGLRNIVAVEERDAWTGEGWHHRDDPANLRDAFARFAPRVRSWLDRVDEVHIWGLFRHPVAERWYDDRHAILGDAAHPTLPFLAQGANMALEDAWALADCLDRTNFLPEALAAYQSRRRARAVRAIEAANANARNYHLSFPPIRAAAHLGLRVAGTLAPSLVLRKFDWLYRHDETAN